MSMTASVTEAAFSELGRSLSYRDNSESDQSSTADGRTARPTLAPSSSVRSLPSFENRDAPSRPHLQRSRTIPTAASSSQSPSRRPHIDDLPGLVPVTPRSTTDSDTNAVLRLLSESNDNGAESAQVRADRLLQVAQNLDEERQRCRQVIARLQAREEEAQHELWAARAQNEDLINRARDEEAQRELWASRAQNEGWTSRLRDQLETKELLVESLRRTVSSQLEQIQSLNLQVTTLEAQLTALETRRLCSAQEPGPIEPKSSVRAEGHLPSQYLCPITQEVMTDPVVATDGFTYERFAIEKWFSKNTTSPMTGARLESKALLPNFNIRSAILEFYDRCNPEQYRIVATLNAHKRNRSQACILL